MDPLSAVSRERYLAITERIKDPGMSSDTADRGVSEYGTSKAQASCTECGTHSPGGEPFTDITKWVVQSVFILPPLIRHPMYHLFLSVLFMSPNLQMGACT